MVKFERSRTRNTNRIVRGSMLILFLGIVLMIIVVFRMYGRIFEPNVNLDEDHTIIYIDSNEMYEAVLKMLEDGKILKNPNTFDWVAGKKGYRQNVKPGRYKIVNGMSNNELINMLRSGRQDPVMVVFNNTRTIPELAGKVSKYIEADSLTLTQYLTDPEVAREYGFDEKDFSTIFIPNTYEFYWTVTPEGFVERMKSEYDNFWKGERDRKAEKMGMTRSEVVTLASIVDEETLYDDENAKIAGVYINRLERGIPLQADPTLKFALGDFSRQRMINDDKKIDSPYNTYINKGLPPGPISIPSISAIDGVLNYDKNNYLFFCAKADFSGYHAFARTLSQHNKNAREYQNALNRNRIYK